MPFPLCGNVQSKLRRAGVWHMPTGHLHLDGFESDIHTNKKAPRMGCFFIGADDRTRTCTLARWNLNPMSLPIPPHPHIKEKASIFTRGGTRGGAHSLIHINETGKPVLLRIAYPSPLVNRAFVAVTVGHRQNP